MIPPLTPPLTSVNSTLPSSLVPAGTLLLVSTHWVIPPSNGFVVARSTPPVEGNPSTRVKSLSSHGAIPLLKLGFTIRFAAGDAAAANAVIKSRIEALIRVVLRQTPDNMGRTAMKSPE